ncbi:MAG: recombinase family protein [Oscillospiraceae bacterium]|jgi:hypothetical protein|nr:recombinase family protein [Oscillospiraceae bacterium]
MKIVNERLRSLREGVKLSQAKIAERHFQINPLTAPFVLEAFKRYDAGATMTEVRNWRNEQGVTNTLGRELNYNRVQLLLNNDPVIIGLS